MNLIFSIKSQDLPTMFVTDNILIVLQCIKRLMFIIISCNYSIIVSM